MDKFYISLRIIKINNIIVSLKRIIVRLIVIQILTIVRIIIVWRIYFLSLEDFLKNKLANPIAKLRIRFRNLIKLRIGLINRIMNR